MCKSCEGKGYVESYHGGANTWTASVQQCPKRCNLKGYSDEVQSRLNDKKRVTAHKTLHAIPSSRPGLRLVE